MKTYNYELSVKIDGNKLPEYGSQGRTYIRGEKGREFTLYFRNNTASKILARFSVDGLSVLDGRAAQNDKGGYVCNPYSIVEINGWRTSLNEVRKFEFSSKGKSYAGKTTGTANCGVIGVQVFEEKYVPPPIYDVDDEPWYHPEPHPWSPHRPIRPYWDVGLMSKSSNKGNPRGQYSAGAPLRRSLCACSSGEVEDYNLGTKFGESKQDVVRKVNFDIGNLVATLEIYYTDRDGLKKAGIDTDKKEVSVVHPKAFGGFCQPPPDED